MVENYVFFKKKIVLQYFSHIFACFYINQESLSKQHSHLVGYITHIAIVQKALIC